MVERGKEEPKDPVAELQMAFGRWEKVVESQPSLQPSTSRGFMQSGPTEPLLSGKTHERARIEFAKKHLKDSSGLMRPRLGNFLALILSGMC